MAQIIGFGASQMEGVGGPNGGWLDFIKLDYHQAMFGAELVKNEERHHVYNLGVAGHTSAQTLARMESELAARGWPDREYIFIYAPSINNDSKGVGSPDNILVSQEESVQSLKQGIELLRRYSQKILVVSSNLPDDKLTNPKGTNYFLSDRTRRYGAAIAACCAELGVPYVDLNSLSDSVEWTGTMLARDGLHPNDAGHRWIYDQVKPELNKLIGESL